MLSNCPVSCHPNENTSASIKAHLIHHLRTIKKHHQWANTKKSISIKTNHLTIASNVLKSNTKNQNKRTTNTNNPRRILTNTSSIKRTKKSPIKKTTKNPQNITNQYLFLPKTKNITNQYLFLPKTKTHKSKSSNYQINTNKTSTKIHYSLIHQKLVNRSKNHQTKA